ncbi:MAG: mechanosensitive ion channel family protein [Candidatus Marinimicrobia bacterium]|nr:mechanosensitive ion channel family protein [Candidatus Neomarinimicrobiota bacterium]MCF7828605.1 mechanosensitive ion channel family protein [Candidatus Neomarinimicrobiota bacterium]MCF7880346.1 mechanosensitive ion channel family protein [Candidatus Neomarinimicrobiota bacterium]
MPAGILILWWLRRYFSSLESRRLTRLDRVEGFNPVETETPLRNSVTSARENAQESMQARYTVIRRTFLITVFIVWVVALLFPFLGSIPATLVSGLAAATAVIIGIAARPFVENLISGIVISLSRQLRTGDTIVIDDSYGTVEDITPTHTIIKLWDWRRHIIPNSKMLSKDFINYTITDQYIWEHVEFWVSPEADLEQVETIARDVARGSEFCAGYEEPRFWTMGMDKDSLKCWVAAWADSPPDAWSLKTDIRKGLTREFQNVGIKFHQNWHQWKAEPDI